MTSASAAEMSYSMEIGGKTLQTDVLGFLLDPSEWDERVAEFIAAAEGIALGDEHWEMIRFVREWFDERQAVPEARWLLKAMKQRLGEEKGTRRYLHHLFPHGYGPELCKVAGMTMPRKLMLDV